MKNSFFLIFALVLSVAGTSIASVGSDSSSVFDAASVPTPSPTPAASPARFDSYRGISIGSPAALVAEKLGAPAQRSKGGDYYVLSNSESAQFGYEASGFVKSISVTYTGDLKAAPSPKDSLGMDVKKESDGSLNKMAQFPKDGYSVTYIRMGGSDALVIVTIQKMARE